MKREDGDMKESGEGRKAYRNASEASVGTMESLRNALLGIVPRIREAAAGNDDDETSIEAAERLGAVQFVCWWDTPDEVTDVALNSGIVSDIDETIRETCLFDDWESFSSAAYSLKDESGFHDGYRGMLYQCVDAVCQGLYGVACAGLCTIFDGLLSDLCETFGDGLGERLGSLIDDIVDETDGQGFYEDQTETLMFLTSFAGAVGSFGDDADFAGREPETLNRIWITHGRVRSDKTMLDCLKLLRMIQGLFILKYMCEDDEDDDG